MSSELLNAELPTNYIYSVKWIGLAEGTEVTYGGQTLVIGVNAFSNAYDAITQACTDYDVVWDDIDWYDEENLPAWKVTTADIYCDTDIAEGDYEAGELVEYDAVNPNNPDEIYGCGIRLTYGTDILNDFQAADTKAGMTGAVVLCGGTYTCPSPRYNTGGTSIAVINGAVVEGSTMTLGTSGNASNYEGSVAVFDGGTITSAIALGGRGVNTGNTYLYMMNESYARVIHMDGESSGNGSSTAVDENGRNLYTNYAFIKDSSFGTLYLARGGINYQNADITIDNSTGNNIYWTGEAGALEMMGDVNITLINASISTIRDESSRGTDSDYDGTMNIYVKGGTSTVATLNLEDSKTTAAGRTITIDANSALIAATCAFTGNIVINVADFELDGDSKFVMSGSKLTGANISIINDVQSQYAYQLSDDGKTISLIYRPVYYTAQWAGMADGTVVSAQGIDDLVIGKDAFGSLADAAATGKEVKVLDVILNNEYVADADGNVTVDGYTTTLNGGVVYNALGSAVTAYGKTNLDGVIHVTGGSYMDANGTANSQTQEFKGYKTVIENATFTTIFGGAKSAETASKNQADITLIGSTVTGTLLGNRYVSSSKDVVFNITGNSYVDYAQVTGISGAGNGILLVENSTVRAVTAGGVNGISYTFVDSVATNVGVSGNANGSDGANSDSLENALKASSTKGDATVNLSGSTISKLYMTRGMDQAGATKVGCVTGDVYLNIKGDKTTRINALYAAKYYSNSVNITVYATATLSIGSYEAKLSDDTNFTVTTDGLELSSFAAKKVVVAGGDQLKGLANYTFTGENSENYASFWNGNVLAVSVKAFNLDASGETLVVAAGDIVYSDIALTINTDGLTGDKLVIDSADNNLALNNITLAGANAGKYDAVITDGDLYLVAKKAYVSALYAGLEEGTEVLVNGVTAIVGQNAFADYDTAVSSGLEVVVVDSYFNNNWVAGSNADVIIGGSTVTTLVGGTAAVDGVFAYDSLAGANADHTAGKSGIVHLVGGTYTGGSHGANISGSKYYDIDGSDDQAGIIIENADSPTTGVSGYNSTITDINIKVVDSNLKMVRGATNGAVVTGVISIDISGSTISGHNTTERYYAVNGLGATTSASSTGGRGTLSLDFKLTDSSVQSVVFGGYGSGTNVINTSGYSKLTMVNSTVAASVQDHWNTTSDINTYSAGQFFDLTNSTIGGRVTIRNYGETFVSLKDASSIYDIVIDSKSGAVSITVSGEGTSSLKQSITLRENDTITIDAATAMLNAAATLTVDGTITVNVDDIQWAEGVATLKVLNTGSALAGNYTLNMSGDDAGRYTISVVDGDVYINRSFAVYSSLWAGLEDGTVVTFSGGTAIIGQNAFADYASAVASGKEVISCIDAYANADWAEGEQTVVINGRTVTTTIGGAAAIDGVYAYNTVAGAKAALTAGGKYGLLHVVGGTYDTTLEASEYTTYDGVTVSGIDVSNVTGTAVDGDYSGNVYLKLTGSTMTSRVTGRNAVGSGTIKMDITDSVILGSGDTGGLNGLGWTTGTSASANEVNLSLDFDITDSYVSKVALFGRGSGGTTGINTTGSVDVTLTGSTVGGTVGMSLWGIKGNAYNIQGGLKYTIDNSIVKGELDISHDSDTVIDIKNGSSVATLSRTSYVDADSTAKLVLNVDGSNLGKLAMESFSGSSVDIDITNSTVDEFTANRNSLAITGDYNCDITNSELISPVYFRLSGGGTIGGDYNVNVNGVSNEFKGFYLVDSKATIGGDFNVSIAGVSCTEGVVAGANISVSGNYTMNLDKVSLVGSVRLLTNSSTVDGNLTVNVSDLKSTYILFADADMGEAITGTKTINFVGGTSTMASLDSATACTVTIAENAVLNHDMYIATKLSVVNNGTINFTGTSLINDYNTYGYTTVARENNMVNNGTLTIKGITDTAVAVDSLGNTVIYALNQSEVYVASDITGNLYDEIHYNGHWMRIGINAFTSIEDAKAFIGENDTTINVSGNAIDTGANFYGDGANIEITDGTFTKGLIGGQEVTADTVIDTDSSIEITGDVSAKAVYGGQYVSGGTATISGDTAATVSGGEFSSLVAGGSVVKTGATAVMSGESTLTITGGVFGNSVAGGSTSQGGTVSSSHDYVANLMISGGTFGKSVYGGNIATKAAYSAYGSAATGGVEVTLIDIAGSTNVNIDASSNSIVFAEGAHIIAGSHGYGQIMGNTTVTLTGLGENLDFTGNLIGGSQNGGTGEGQSCVTGSRSLIFDNFDGDLNAARIVGFSDVAFENGSVMTFTNAVDMAPVVNWSFSDGSSLVWTDGVSDFAGDTINISMSDDFELGEDGWTLISGGANIFGSFSQIADNGISINGVTAELDLLSDNNRWIAGEYQLALDETNWTLKVSTIA